MSFMGVILSLECRHCDYEFQAFAEVGMMYSYGYSQTVKQARNGELGEEIQRFFEEHPDGLIDASNVIGQCTQCGKHYSVPDLSMYVPKENVEPDPSDLWPMAFWNDGITCVEPGALREGRNYTLIGKYSHKCEACGGALEVFSDRRGPFNCPKCHRKIFAQDSGMWD